MRRGTLVLLVAAALAGGGCKTVAKGKQFAKQIEDHLASQGNPGTVTCPDRIELGMVEDNHFECEVLLQTGERGPIEVSLDDKLTLMWQSKTPPP